MDSELRRTVWVCWALAIIGAMLLGLAATADDTSGMIILVGAR